MTLSGAARSPSIWRRNFDIDNYLNRIVPSSRWHTIPYPVAYFFGYRKKTFEKYGNLLLTARATIGIFSSLLLIQLASHQVLGVASNGPLIVASFVSHQRLTFIYHTPEILGGKKFENDNKEI